MVQPVCVVSGVGPGLGRSLVETFAGAGYRVVALARRQTGVEDATRGLDGVVTLACDATRPDDVARAFGRIKAEIGTVECLLYNTGSSVWGSAAELTAEAFDGSWRANALGLFLAAKQVAPDMLAAGTGVIGVTGAGAALRGRARTAAFAAAKAAQRSLAQSLARDLGPQGIHVFYAIIDGRIDTPKRRAQQPDLDPETCLDPKDIAACYLGLARQPRTAWTFEIDLRPHVESW